MVFFYYVFSLAAGALCLILVYRLIHRYRLPFLLNLFYFLLLTQVWGFILWILPILVPSFFGEAYVPYESVLPVFHLAKWFGFPIQILHAYFLWAVVMGMLNIPLKKRYVWIYVSISILILAAVLSGFYSGFRTKNYVFFSSVSYITTYLFLLFEWAVLIFGYIKSRERSETPRRRYLPLFFILYGFGIWLYILFGLIDWPLEEFALVTSYYALHIPPVLYLYYHLGRESRLTMFEGIRLDDMEGFLISRNLTKRECQIVELLIQGRTNRDMERELFISLQTVKNYITSVYKKLQVRNRVELVNLIHNRFRDVSRT